MNREIYKLKLQMINYEMKKLLPNFRKFDELQEEYTIIKEEIGLTMQEEFKMYEKEYEKYSEMLK